MKMIYKYRKYDRYAFNELAYGKLYGCRPDCLNDPFDSFVNFSFTDIYDKLTNKEKINELFKTYEIRRENKKDNQEDFLYKLFNLFINSFYVFSFSKTSTNPILWAHYANNYSGVSLGYDENEINSLINNRYLNNEQKKFANKFRIQDVTYTDELNIEDIINKLDGLFGLLKIKNLKDFSLKDEPKAFEYFMENWFDLVFFKKTKIWSAEEECRLVIPNLLIKENPKDSHCGISQVNAKEVCFPKHISLEARYTIYNVCDKKQIKMNELFMYAGESGFGLTCKEIPKGLIDMILNSPLTIG